MLKIRLLRAGAVALTVWMLSACAGLGRHTETAGGESNVTVYGTADAGVGRIEH